MSQEPGVGRLVGWLAGIAVAVLACYLVWHLTEPKPPQPPSPPSAPAVTTIEGMVYSGGAPVVKAMVAVQLTGAASANGPVYDITDGNGAYRFDIARLPRDASVTLIVRANGYETPEPKSIVGPLDLDTHEDFPLVAVPGPGSGSVAPLVQQQAGKIPAYVEKSAAAGIQVKIAAPKQ